MLLCVIFRVWHSNGKPPDEWTFKTDLTIVIEGYTAGLILPPPLRFGSGQNSPKVDPGLSYLSKSEIQKLTRG